MPVHELPRQAVRRAGCKACSISIHIEVDFLLVTFNPLSAPLTHSTPDPVMRDPNTALEKLTSLFSAECGILLVPVFASELPLSVSKNLSVLCSGVQAGMVTFSHKDMDFKKFEIHILMSMLVATQRIFGVSTLGLNKELNV